MSSVGARHGRQLSGFGTRGLAFLREVEADPEWDLTLTALYYECGWFSLDQYAGFADAYGFDVRTSAGGRYFGVSACCG